MRPVLLLRTGAIVALSLTVTSVALATSFSDVTNTHNQTAIEFLNKRGMIHGYGNGTFKPNATINRAELAKILVTATGTSPTVAQYHDCFTDVAKEWFAPFVCYAKEKGWVAGYSDGTFRPANPVNTVEAIKMILRAQGITVAVSADNNPFSDVDFSAWYASYVETANGKGLLEISRGKLNINAHMKRGGIAEMMYRSLFIREIGAAKFDDANEPGHRDQNSSKMRDAYKENLQQYLAQANAASDKTTLTKDQFTAELTNGKGYGPQVLLATATTFLTYTDPDGKKILLALDAKGTVVFKRPGGFGSGLALGMLAQELGITTDRLKSELDDGKTLQQIAQAHGVAFPFPMGNHGDRVHETKGNGNSSKSSSSSYTSSSTSSSSSSYTSSSTSSSSSSYTSSSTSSSQ